jgi:hypothetical protein
VCSLSASLDYERTSSRARRDLRSPGGRRPQVLAVELQQVEGVEDGVSDMAALVERIERDDAGDHRFPVNAMNDRAFSLAAERAMVG